MKATVDAYDGTVTLYAVGRGGPGAPDLHEGLPGTSSQPKSEMTDELQSHVRYPEDLFKVQRDILTRYHVDDPVDFYNEQRPLAGARTTRPGTTDEDAAAVLHPGPAAGRRRGAASS